MGTKVPAVVVGAGINGLGVARSLARAGVPAWLLDNNARQLGMSTRAARALVIGAMHGDALIEELIRVAGTHFAGVRPVLLLTQEDSVHAISRHRERLADSYHFSLPPKTVVDTLTHKHGFQRAAESFGAPIPALVHVASIADLSALESLHYPVVVKPGARHDGYGRQFRKAYRVETQAEAIDLVRRILPVMADVVVQEWTEGPDSAIYFCLQYVDAQGQPAASFTGRKIRSWPPQVGGTASCGPAPEAHTELSDLTTRFFRHAGVVGMAGMEYKRDAASGQFRMVEPTIGRTDYQAEVATLNGVNLPHAAYCSELGIAFAAPRPRPRAVAWRVRSQDLQSAARQHQRPADALAVFDAVADALWRASDPRPYLDHNGRRVGPALRTRVAGLMSRSKAAGGES
jgi:predicted ATP-grasp superfamily ATP-dependent carboligase